jgi:hypothetical protein
MLRQMRGDLRKTAVLLAGAYVYALSVPCSQSSSLSPMSVFVLTYVWRRFYLCVAFSCDEKVDGKESLTTNRTMRWGAGFVAMCSRHLVGQYHQTSPNIMKHSECGIEVPSQHRMKPALGRCTLLTQRLLESASVIAYGSGNSFQRASLAYFSSLMHPLNSCFVKGWRTSSRLETGAPGGRSRGGSKRRVHCIVAEFGDDLDG